MTRKELQETIEWYKNIARDCLAAKNICSCITAICHEIATEACYNHHERGQRLWAFFQALDEALKEAE